MTTSYPAQMLVDRAHENTSALLGAIVDHEVATVDIFGTDGAVTGGRNVITVLGRENLDDVTDIQTKGRARQSRIQKAA